MGKKWFRYTSRFKNYEVELTWEMFIKGLNEVMEYFFHYGNLTIDVAFHFENEHKVYELNINGGETPIYLTFNTIDELVSYKAFDGKSLYDIWDDLEN